MKKNFVLIGVGGYIAPRHLESIKDAGHNLVAAYDPKDSVGILDRFFPDCQFFTEFERFECFVNSLMGTQKQVDFVSVCSPNYLHFGHISYGLRIGADVICEKPIVLTTQEIDQLVELEKKTQRKVYTVLQLRVHDAIIALKNKIENEKKSNYKIDLTYMTSRGNWYLESWKGDVKKSGGLSTNIGVHFFDMLTWIFGNVKNIKMEVKTPTMEKGVVELEKAQVIWKLSIDRRDLPQEAIDSGKTTFRSITINGENFEFSEGFTELHKKVYSDVFNGRGYTISDARPAIEIVEQIRGIS